MNFHPSAYLPPPPTSPNLHPYPPPCLGHQVLRSLNSCLREDQLVEVVDKNCISQVRAAAVTQVIGRRLHIRYLDAPEDDGGFWCHENSPLVSWGEGGGVV